MSFVLDLEHITVQAGRRAILDDVSLRVAPGQRIAVLGPNGAGKTTLLEVVMGFQRPSAGRVLVDGRPWRRADRPRFGYVFQRYSVDPGAPFSVADVILMGASARLGLTGRPGRQDRQRLVEVARFVGLEERLPQPAGTLSGGEQQKLAIARCLMQQASFLLLDEVTANLDFAARRSVMALLDRLHEQYPISTLLVTHWVESIPASCREVVCLNRGRVIHRGPAGALDPARLDALYANGEG